MNIIIEGVDRLGKGTLIQGLKNELGATVHIHYQKPELLKYYIEQAKVELSGMEEAPSEGDIKKLALKLYQHNSFSLMFHMLDNVAFGLILDRAHLGEMVYAPRYRGYSGDYVLNLETVAGVSIMKDALVLLTSSDMSFLQDDGLSFDFNAKEAEQLDFITAFDRSAYRNKLMIDVCLKDVDGNSLKRYAPAELILEAVLDMKSYGYSQRTSFIQKPDGTVEAVSVIES